MPDKVVELPDGRTVAFPDSMSDVDIEAVLSKETTSTQPRAVQDERPGFFGGLGEGLVGTPHPLKAIGSGLKTLLLASVSPQSPEAQKVEEAVLSLGRGIKGEAKRGFGIATGNQRLILESLAEEGRSPTTGTEAVARTIPLGLGVPIETFAGGEVSRGAGQTLGTLLGLVAPTKGAGKSLLIAGKKFPATLGMLKPGTKLAKFESLLEDVPIIGGPIKATKTEKVPLAARGAISDIASREARVVGRGAAGFIEDVKGAGVEFHREARTLYQSIEKDLAPLKLDTEFVELQSQRQELQRARRRPTTSKEWVEINKDLAATEDDLDALFKKADKPALTKSFEDANALTGRAHAVEEFHKALSTSTRGLPEAKTPSGAAPRPQEINSQMLLSRVRKMSELRGGGGISRLEQAFGKQGAAEVLDVAEMLDRARLDKSLGARLRQIGTGTTFLGLGGAGIYLSAATTAVAIPALATGAYITARAMANPSGRRLLRSFLAATPNSRRATYLAGRIAEIAKQPENEEQSSVKDIPPL